MQDPSHLIVVGQNAHAEQDRLIAKGYEYVGVLDAAVCYYGPENAPRLRLPFNGTLFAVHSRAEADAAVSADSDADTDCILLGPGTLLNGKQAWILMRGSMDMDAPLSSEELMSIGNHCMAWSS